MRVVSFPPSFLTFWDSGEKEFGHLKMRFEWVYIEKERIVCDYASVAFSMYFSTRSSTKIKVWLLSDTSNTF
jgi:hypothetical protein